MGVSYISLNFTETEGVRTTGQSQGTWSAWGLSLPALSCCCQREGKEGAISSTCRKPSFSLHVRCSVCHRLKPDIMTLETHRMAHSCTCRVNAAHSKMQQVASHCTFSAFTGICRRLPPSKWKVHSVFTSLQHSLSFLERTDVVRGDFSQNISRTN